MMLMRSGGNAAGCRRRPWPSAPSRSWPWNCWPTARWVSCDEGYGRSVDFLDGVAVLGLGRMAEVPADTRVWPERPPTVVLRTRVRLVPGAPASLEARTLAEQLPSAAWTRRRVPEHADFAIQRVVASRASLPGPDVWLMLRRQPGADTVRAFLCHAPRRITSARLACLTGARWAIETCFRESKQLLGLGSCEGSS